MKEIIEKYQTLVNQLKRIVDNTDDSLQYFKSLYREEKGKRIALQRKVDKLKEENKQLKEQLVK